MRKLTNGPGIALRIIDIQRELNLEGKLITSELIKARYLGVTERPRMLIEIYAQHIEECKALVGNGLQKVLLRNITLPSQQLRNFWNGNLN